MMFERIGDLPLHPLAVHMPVMFIPLCAIIGLAYLLVSRWRSALTWAAVALAVLAPLSAFVAVESGKALRRVHSVSGAEVDEHESFGENTLYASIALGLALLSYIALQWFFSHRDTPSWGVYLQWVLYISVILAAIVATVYVVYAGDSGATLVWGHTFDH